MTVQQIEKFGEKELQKLEKNLEIKSNEVSFDNINMMKKYLAEQKIKRDKEKNIIDQILKLYDMNCSAGLESYVVKFVDRLSRILGNKIKLKDSIIYLKETVYVIDHDYMGNINKEPIIILSSEDKINITHMHPSFKKDVIWYRDKSSKVYVYYDSITLQHLGYSEDNKIIKKSKSNVSLKMELSIKDCIMLLGYENQYFNLHHINKDYFTNIPENLGTGAKELVLTIIRNRLVNIKQIIERSKSIVYNIRNSGVILSKLNIDEKEIVSDFTKKLKKFNIKDDGDFVLGNHEVVNNNLSLDTNIPENINVEINSSSGTSYIDTMQLNVLNNTDIKYIFYLIYNFNKLLDYNKAPAIESEISQLLIRMIRYQFNFYYRPYSNYMIRRFDYLLINEDIAPYIDETIKPVGLYQELLTQHEIDDPEQKEKNYDAIQESESLDIDDYEVDDDIDGRMEALEGDIY